MASSVELEPAPAMTGMRPAAVFTQSSTTCRCSSCDSVVASPVVPQGTSACVPAATCRSTIATNALSSTFPSRNGVTRAGIDPLKVGGRTGMSISGSRAGASGGAPAGDSPDNHFMGRFGKRMMSRFSPGQLGRTLAAIMTLGALAAAPALANPAAPSLKPAPVLQSTWMEQGEFTLLSRALDAADNNRWPEVRSALGRLTDPAAQALVRWRLATSGNAGMGHAELPADRK